MATASSRMLALLSLLQTPRDWPGRVLAERLEVAPRTVRRDVERLRELGYRITALKGPDGGYRLAAGSELPPLLFDDDQAVAIAVGEAAHRALATVRQVMPSRLRHRIDGIRFSGSDAATRVDPSVLEAVSAAVRDHRMLRFDYGDHDRPARRTEPHAVAARGGHWYLVAWDLEADDWRTFRLDRLRPRIPTGPGFTPRPLPADDVQTYLAARAKGSTDRDVWPCIGHVEVELPAREVARWLGADGTVEAIDDARCRATVGSWSWNGVLAFLAGLDAPFTILGPDALSDAAAALSGRLSDAGARSWMESAPGRASSAAFSIHHRAERPAEARFQTGPGALTDRSACAAPPPRHGAP